MRISVTGEYITTVCGKGSPICCVTLYSSTIRGVCKSSSVSTNVYVDIVLL